MQHLGTVKIRDRGIITLPAPMRKKLKINIGDEISILLDKGQIIIKKPKNEYDNFDID